MRAVLLFTIAVEGWTAKQGLVGATALSTTSVALVYAIIADENRGRTRVGQIALAARFVISVNGSAIAGLTSALLAIKLAGKWAAIVPLTRAFATPLREGWSIALLMSTGLTFGTVTALAGLSFGIIDQQQYAALVTTVIASRALSAFVGQKVLQSTGHAKQERSAADSS